MLRSIVYFAFILTTTFPLIAASQNTAPDNEIKEFEIAGYDTNAYHPLFIQSRDGLFKLNIGFYTQIRYNANLRQELPDSIEGLTRGWNMARSRMFFEGDLTSKFYYHFRVNINSSGNWELFVAYLQWNFHEKWNIRMGKQFMALGREDWMYPQDLASMEFSAHDFTYAIWTSFGFQIRHVPTNNLRYWLSIGNGAYGSRRSFPQPFDSDLAFTGRLEWNILGSEWIQWDDMTSRPRNKLGMLLGIGLGQQYRYDKEALKTSAKRSEQINIDYSLAGNGFQLFAQTSATRRSFESNSPEAYTNWGGYTTFGYWLSDQLFPYLRYDIVSAGNQQGNWEDYSSPGIGISIYPFNWTRRSRFTLEYNYLGAILNNTIVEADGQLGLIESSYGAQQSIRFQLQFGF